MLAFFCALLAGGAVAAQEPSWFAALVADDRVPGWSQGLLRGSKHSLGHRSDGQGRLLFGEVGVREVEIARQPAFEFVLRAAPR